MWMRTRRASPTSLSWGGCTVLDDSVCGKDKSLYTDGVVHTRHGSNSFHTFNIFKDDQHVMFVDGNGLACRSIYYCLDVSYSQRRGCL